MYTMKLCPTHIHTNMIHVRNHSTLVITETRETFWIRCSYSLTNDDENDDDEKIEHAINDAGSYDDV